MGIELESRTVVDELPQDALLPPAPTPLRPGARHQVQSPKIPPLQVPKCEIFDRSDFHNFYSIKSLWEGDFGVKIKKYFKNI